MTSANLTSSRRGRTRQTMSYLWVMVGSALGGLLRFAIGKLAIALDTGIGFPIGTVFIHVIGSVVIGYFGTLTLHNGRYPVSENIRIFVMIGICGGFTTFSSFSLQTFDLARSCARARAPAPERARAKVWRLKEGEGGKAPADSDHDKDANVFGDGISAVVQGERAEVADDERADHVDKDGADGEANTSVEGNCELADGEPQESAQCTTDHNPEIGHRLPRSSSS